MWSMNSNKNKLNSKIILIFHSNPNAHLGCVWLGWKQEGWKIWWKMSFSTAWLRKKKRQKIREKVFPLGPLFLSSQFGMKMERGKCLEMHFTQIPSHLPLTLFMTWWLLPLLSNLLWLILLLATLPLFFFFFPFDFLGCLFSSYGQKLFFSSSSSSKVAFSFPLFFSFYSFFLLARRDFLLGTWFLFF